MGGGKKHYLEDSSCFSLSCEAQKVGFKCFLLVIAVLIQAVHIAARDLQFRSGAGVRVSSAIGGSTFSYCCWFAGLGSWLREMSCRAALSTEAGDLDAEGHAQLLFHVPQPVTN